MKLLEIHLMKSLQSHLLLFTVVSMELQRQAASILNSQAGSSSSSISATFANQALDNLRLHKYQSLHFQKEVEHLNTLISTVKIDLSSKIDERLPTKVISAVTNSEKKQAKLEQQMEVLESKVKVLDSRMHEMLQHQRVQTNLLQHLLMASGISVPRPPTLAANKKGEKEPLPYPAELVRRIPPPFYTEKEKKRIAALDSIEERLDQMLGKKSSSTS